MTIHKPFVAGSLFLVLGAFFSLYAYRTLDMGTLSEMGPGYFPVLLGVILAGLGAAIGLRGIFSMPSPWGHISWRGLFLLGLAPVLFALTIHGLGLVGSVAATAAVAAFGSRLMTGRVAAGIVMATTIICVLIFHSLVGLPIPLLGTWLRGVS